MNSKRSKSIIWVAYGPILIFFLMTAIFSSVKKGETIAAITQDFVVSVKDGVAAPNSYAIDVEVPREGSYQFDLKWDCDNPPFLTGCGLQNPDGSVAFAFSAFQVSYSNQLQLPAGKNTIEFYFLTNDDAYRDFAGLYEIFEDETDLSQYLEALDLASNAQNGDCKLSISLDAYELTGFSVPFKLFTLLEGLITLVLLFFLWKALRQENDELEGTMHGIGVRYAFFAMLVTFVQLTTAVLAEIFVPGMIQSIGNAFSLLLILFSVDLIGFPAIYLLTRKVPATKLPEKKLGVGRFILFVLMSAGLCGVGGLVGIIVHGLLTTPFGGNNSGLTDLLMSSGMVVRVLTVGILAPVFEELIFRKLLIDRLIRHGEFIAILTSGVLFGLFHGNFQQFFFATMLGFLWAFVYIRTGRIRYTIGMHMTINTATSAITNYLAAKFMEYYPSTATDNAAIIEALQADPQAAIYIGLYYLWLLILAVTCVAGAIICLVFLGTGRFKLRRQENELSRGTLAKTLFTDKYMWLFYFVCIGLFMIVYLPAMLQ